MFQKIFNEHHCKINIVQNLLHVWKRDQFDKLSNDMFLFWFQERFKIAFGWKILVHERKLAKSCDSKQEC